ncbi:hypothetical protein LCALC10_1900 [Lacticaseibacillus paracasei]|nr:hypothetical protein LCALC10_1900 [Lacticaseibacillus paracasei]
MKTTYYAYYSTITDQNSYIFNFNFAKALQSPYRDISLFS